MSEKLEIPKWVDKIMGLWEKNHRRALPKELRALWRESHRRTAEMLKMVNLKESPAWRRAWFEYLTGIYEEASNTEMNLRIDVSDSQPAWFENLEGKVMGAYMPSVNFKAMLQNRPSQTLAITCGEWVGHEYMAWATGDDRLTVGLEKASEEYRKAYIALLAHMRPQRMKMINKAQAIANQQPYKEARQFFRGYFLALDRGTLQETGEPVGATYATPIHRVMYIYADFLPRLKNNSELLDWLKEVLGKSQSWNESSFKRVEKITQHLDLHLGQRGASDTSAQTMSD